MRLVECHRCRTWSKAGCFAAIAAAALVACHRTPTDIERTRPDASLAIADSPDRVFVAPAKSVDPSELLSPEVQVLGAAINRFTLALDRAERSLPVKSTRNENLLLSPVSMYITLALLYEGSRGPTRVELARVLGVESSPTSLMDGIHALSKSLDLYPGSTFDAATSLWLQGSLTTSPDFQRIAQEGYGARVETFEPVTDNTAAISRINSWADSHSHHLITQGISADSVGKQPQLVAVSLAYFLTDWRSSFKRSRTMLRSFYSASGAELDVPTMLQKAVFKYSRTPLGRSVLLPCADNDLSVLIVVPEDQKWFSKPLPRGFLEACTRDMNFAMVDLELPKFDLQLGLNWTPLLQQLGLSNSLISGAPFSGVVEKSPVKLSAVAQRVRVRVDEEGTEATAIRSSGLSTIYDERPTIDLRVNRPFLFVLRSKRADAILFWGRVGSF